MEMVTLAASLESLILMLRKSLDLISNQNQKQTLSRMNELCNARSYLLLWTPTGLKRKRTQAAQLYIFMFGDFSRSALKHMMILRAASRCVEL